MTAVEALQETLAAEHAAVYAFGVLGGRAAGLSAPLLRGGLATAYDVHVARRDHLRSRVTALGADPVAADPAYGLPRALTTFAEISLEALRVERASVTTYAALVAATTGADRTWAVDTLAAGAVSQLGFGGPAEALPGLRVHRVGGPRRP